MISGELDLKIASLDQAISSKDREILYRQAKIDQLTHEMAVLKRWKFGRSREQLDAGQTSLLDETIDADIAAIEQELENLAPAGKTDKDAGKKPKRAALPAELPRSRTAPRARQHYLQLRMPVKAMLIKSKPVFERSFKSTTYESLTRISGTCSA